ncbi:MAG: hypothetical protein WKG07_18070 [Hymenobacter sp.]
MRREFQAILDQAPIAATSILNGAFGEILSYNIPLLDFKAAASGLLGGRGLAHRLHHDGRHGRLHGCCRPR